MSRSYRFGVYVASRASIPERSAMWREIRGSGVPINSTWIDEAGEGETEDFVSLWLRIHNEIRQSTMLILYAEPGDFPLKGALVEVGIALDQGIPVRVVLSGVNLEEPSCRPIGSWIKHPMVERFPSIAAALGADLPGFVDHG